MPRTITFRMACKTGPVEAEGEPMNLKVGDRKVPFVLHGGDRLTLSHRPSGLKLVDLHTYRLAAHVNRGTAPNVRRLAQWWLDKVVYEKGADHVLKIMTDAEVINR